MVKKTETAATKRKVALIVDDIDLSDYTQDYCGSLIQSSAIDFRHYHTPSEALSALRQEKFDLVLLSNCFGTNSEGDNYLHQKSLELTQNIRGIRVNKRTPIVVFSFIHPFDQVGRSYAGQQPTLLELTSKFNYDVFGEEKKFKKAGATRCIDLLVEYPNDFNTILQQYLK